MLLAIHLEIRAWKLSQIIQKDHDKITLNIIYATVSSEQDLGNPINITENSIKVTLKETKSFLFTTVIRQQKAQ